MNVPPIRHPRPAVIALAGALALALSGCETMSEREKGTAQGAAIGAVAGAVLSSATGGKAGTGAVAGAAVGAFAGNLWSKRMEEKRRAMERATAGTGIEVAKTADNQLQVNVPSDLSFATGRADLNPQLRPVLDQFAQGLDATVQVRIVGHTDSTGTDAINDPLSLERARTVRAGWVQKISKKGWVCKTWEGELALVSLPGSTVEKFFFTVHDEQVAAEITKVIGKRVSLHYEEKVGLPGSCFGDTRHFVTQVTETPDIPLGPGVSLPTRPASAASAP